ncbi:chemotaxis protein CheA [Mesorhizobium sp. M0091]|uniref:chemotaxis protein CheA n=1 Tax=Mesorhizobium sp. M0091 TaxID=2956875 RepID=UPI00333C06FC
MIELLEQFLVECRESVQQATLDLLALEGDAGDHTRLDSAFRSFHTLKGGAGIVDFPDMARGLHAAEELLASARSGTRTLSTADIGNCLWALDQVTGWLDGIEVKGIVPEDAGSTADEIVRRLQAALWEEPPGKSPPALLAAGWLTSLLKANHDVAVRASTGLLFQPNPQCFFRGEDPLALVAGLPGLLALHVEQVHVWPSLREGDPFECNLLFTALSSAPKDALLRHTQAISSDSSSVLEIRELSSAVPDQRAGLSRMARLVLEAQSQLLSQVATTGLAGRVGAARRVVMNILARSVRHKDALERYDGSVPDADDPEGRQALILLIDRVLGDDAQVLEFSVNRDSRLAIPNSNAARSLRVSVERIDALVNLAGELSIAKNALTHAATLARSGTPSAALAAVLEEQQSRLARLVDQLQRSVLSIRVLPMRQVFQRFQRLVRDLATETGKSVVLVTEGENTEADKTIVEALGEPIMHVLRNAIDHGVEPADERIRTGKPPHATICLRAAKVGDSIVVEVEDDGRGVDFARVRRVAAERGLTTGFASLSDDDALELLFNPGFSTAATVNTVSGRGVGMDAVRSAIEALGGSVGIETKAGSGTIAKFTLPYSILMTPLVTVEVVKQVFGVPLEKVIETRRLSRGDVSMVGAARVFGHRGHTIPLVSLAATLGETPSETIADEFQVVVVLVGNDMCGIEIDDVGETMDILMRPIEGVLAGIEGVAGVTILGDGRVMLVLDVEALLK